MNERVVYTWPDGIFVNLILRGSSTIFSIKRPLFTHGLSMSLFSMERVSTRRGDLMMFPYKVGPIPAPVIDRAFLPKLLGFLLDLKTYCPTARRSLIPRDVPPRDSQGEDYAPYPRFVPDIRWEDRYEEANRFIVRPATEHVVRSEKYLGILRHFEVLPPEFYLDDTWHATYSSMVAEQMSAAYFHSLIDKVLDQELILPESSRTAWESANVERGTFVLPSPEEVQVYNILDEPLPLLLPVEQLEEWLRSRE